MNLISVDLRKFKINLFTVFALTFTLIACGGGGGGGSGGSSNSQQALQDEIDSLFPFTPNQPIDVTYVCARTNSVLTYYFDFDLNSIFTIYITTDTGLDVFSPGTYTYLNDKIRMTSPTNTIIPGYDETTTNITSKMGLVASFQTPGMACVAYGHGYNTVNTPASYGCPYINIGPASREVNAIQFVHDAIPFNFPVAGSIFRQKDVEITIGNPIITRGYGIYRRIGDKYYADFYSQFNDYNLLSGDFSNSDQQITVDQLEPSAGSCARR